MTMDKKTYTRLMEHGASDIRLENEVWDELNAFAQAKKLKRPDPRWKLGRTVTKKQCSVVDCERTSAAKGLCNAHYTAERRKDPEVLAKAREASKRAYAKRVSEKADA